MENLTELKEHYTKNPYKEMEDIVKAQMISLLQKKLDFVSLCQLSDRLKFLESLLKAKDSYAEIWTGITDL